MENIKIRSYLYNIDLTELETCNLYFCSTIAHHYLCLGWQGQESEIFYHFLLTSVSLQSINMQKAFKMTIHCDSQVTARSTIPDAMQEVYENSEPVPELDSLNEFRSDGKSSLKFYTDPNYFFELWMEKMNKELESKKRKKVGTKFFNAVKRLCQFCVLKLQYTAIMSCLYFLSLIFPSCFWFLLLFNCSQYK